MHTTDRPMIVLDLTGPRPAPPEKDADRLARFAAHLAEGLGALAAEAVLDGRVDAAADLARTRADLLALVPGARLRGGAL